MRSMRRLGSVHAGMSFVLAAVLVGPARGLAAPPAAMPIGCVPDGRVKVVVKFAPPAGQDIAGVKVVLDYPKTAVTIPGFQNDPQVQARVADVPASFMSAPNDTDDKLIMAIAGMAVLPASTIFSVDFDRCKGGPRVHAADFQCQVPEASDPKGELVPGSACTVEVASDGAQAKAGSTSPKAKRGSAK